MLVLELVLQDAAEFTPRPRELSGHRCLVLAEDTTGLGQGELLNVVAAQAQPVWRVERREHRFKHPAEEHGEPVPIRAGVMSDRHIPPRRSLGDVTRVGLQRLDALAGPDSVDMPLGEHRPEPCLQRAPAVEVSKQRQTFDTRFERGTRVTHAIELGPESVGELLTGCVVAEEDTRCAIQGRPIGQDHVLPRDLVAGCAQYGQAEISPAQRGDVVADGPFVWRRVLEPMADATVDSLGERRYGQATLQEWELAEGIRV